MSGHGFWGFEPQPAEAGPAKKYPCPSPLTDANVFARGISGGSGDLQSMKLQPAPPGVKLFGNGCRSLMA
jgi:hypothetical protein